jgi:hypothetical protein
MKLTTFKIRAGKVMPKMCQGNVSQGLVVFCFGTETQDVYYCSKDNQMVKSEDMALNTTEENAVFSAQYRAYKGLVDDEIVYNSILTTTPIMQGGDCFGSNGGSGGGSNNSGITGGG